MLIVKSTFQFFFCIFSWWNYLSISFLVSCFAYASKLFFLYSPSLHVVSSFIRTSASWTWVIPSLPSSVEPLQVLQSVGRQEVQLGLVSFNLPAQGCLFSTSGPWISYIQCSLKGFFFFLQCSLKKDFCSVYQLDFLRRAPLRIPYSAH